MSPFFLSSQFVTLFPRFGWSPSRSIQFMFEMNCYLWRHLLSSSSEIKLGVSLQSDYFLDSCPGSGGAENGVVTGLGVGQRWGWSHDHCALERQSVVVVGRDLAVALCSAGERHCPLLWCTAPLSRPSTPPTQPTDTPQLNIALDTYLWAKVRNNGQNYNEPTYWQKIRCCLHNFALFTLVLGWHWHNAQWFVTLFLTTTLHINVLQLDLDP